MMGQSQETKDAMVARDIKELVKNFDKLVKDMDDKDRKYFVVFATKEELSFVRDALVMLRNIVFGFCGLILTGFVLALVRVVWK